MAMYYLLKIQNVCNINKAFTAPYYTEPTICHVYYSVKTLGHIFTQVHNNGKIGLESSLLQKVERMMRVFKLNNKHFQKLHG